MLPFSQRFGFKPVRQSFQVDSMDSALTTCLWNTYYVYFDNALVREINAGSAYEYMWTEFLKRDITAFNYNMFDREIKKWFFELANWSDIYELLEFCCGLLDLYPEADEIKESFIEECNRILEREMSAYRFVNGYLVRITSEVELDSIEQATQNINDRWRPVAEHLRTALTMFSDRQNPDYRNSVKESISAIESACKIITGDDKATLGTALKVLETKGNIHPSLKASFDKLYGYTSNQGGIRHALLEGSNPVTFDEAKFMLVACSAFANYLQPYLL